MSVNKKSITDFLHGRGMFTQVPNELWTRRDLDFTQKAIWCNILSREPEWKGSRNNLARNLHLGKDTVAEAITKLEALGLLSKTADPNTGAWNFEIHPPDVWSVDLVALAEAGPNGGRTPIQVRARTPRESTLKKQGRIEEEDEGCSPHTSAPEVGSSTGTSAPPFSDVLKKWAHDLTSDGVHNAIKWNNVENAMESLIGQCKAMGLPQGELSSNAFLRECSIHSKKFREDDSWQKKVAEKFKGAVVGAFLTLPPPKVKTQENKEHEAYEITKTRYKKFKLQGDT